MTGVPVLVDSDDLEKLLFTTGAIKTIENILHNRNEDPFYQSAQGGYEEAHKRMNTAWLRAKRKPLDPTEPSRQEVWELVNLSTIGMRHKMNSPMVAGLRAKRLIEMGNTFWVTRWADTGQVENKPMPEVSLRLTERGADYVKNYHALTALPGVGNVIENDTQKLIEQLEE